MTHTFFFDWDNNKLIDFDAFIFNGVEDIIVKRDRKLVESYEIDFSEHIPLEMRLYAEEKRWMYNITDFWASNWRTYKYIYKLMYFRDLEFYYRFVLNKSGLGCQAEFIAYYILIKLFKKDYITFFYYNLSYLNNVLKNINNPCFHFSFANFSMFDSVDFIDSFLLLQDFENTYNLEMVLDIHFLGIWIYCFVISLTLLYLLIDFCFIIFFF